jgi:hypothetical protein
MTLPVRDRRYGSRLNLEAHIHTDGSLESVGRRISLFARLIEEYGITNLQTKSWDSRSFSYAQDKFRRNDTGMSKNTLLQTSIKTRTFKNEK